MPYEEPLAFAARAGTRLAGTMTRPERDPPVPAALLLSGSGPLDRDSNMRRQVLNVGSALAAALAAHGVASLRYDKRGVGESGGDYLTTGFDQETDDAVAALTALRAAAVVDRDRVALVGHSVGATIAMRLAGSGQPVAGIVLLAGACRCGEDVMRDQSERIAATMPGPAWLGSRRLLRRQDRTRRSLLASTGDVARVGFVRLPARWFREFMSYDPAADLRAIRCPVLAITGRNDLQVDPDDVAWIGRLVTGPFSGETPDGLTHLMRTSPGPLSLRGYRAQTKQPVDATLLEGVARWVAAL
jgi:pimeloyl-ACP methyl ester carboxylesterase